MADELKVPYRGTYNTIEDMLKGYYGDSDGLSMTKDAMLTTSLGYVNTIYGAKLWAQMILSGKIWAILPKVSWDKSGYRAVTGLDSSSPGVAENAKLPAATLPKITQIHVKGKNFATTVEQSSLSMYLEGTDDNVPWSDIVDLKMKEFIHKVNTAMCADVAAGAAGNNPESIDRIISSSAEIRMAPLSSKANDVYNISRAAAGWSDAQVVSAAAEGADGALTLNHLRHLITLCQPYWDNESYNGKVIVTGYDTKERIEQLVQTELRYPMPTVTAKITVNGVSTDAGMDVGARISSYNSIPIFCDASVPKDTISRVYLIDPDYLKFAVIQPTQYVESGDFLALDVMQRKGLFHMAGETVCTKFAAQGKLRDLA